MAKWTLIREDDTEGTIYKDGFAYQDCDISWLPDNVRAAQSSDGVEVAVEYKGEQVWYPNSSSLSWWSNVETTWNAAETAAAAALAAKQSGG